MANIAASILVVLEEVLAVDIAMLSVHAGQEVCIELGDCKIMLQQVRELLSCHVTVSLKEVLVLLEDSVNVSDFLGDSLDYVVFHIVWSFRCLLLDEVLDVNALDTLLPS